MRRGHRHPAALIAAGCLTLGGCRSCEAPLPQVEETPSPATAESPIPPASPVVSISAEVGTRWGSVTLRVAPSGNTGKPVDVVLVVGTGGTPVSVPGTDLALEFLAFAPNFQMSQTVISSDAEAKNPAAQVRVLEKGAPVFEGWIFPFEGIREWSDPRYDLRLLSWAPR